MTLILKILSVLGIILAVLLLILLWIILMPRHFWVEYSKPESLMVKMNIGPFKISLFPLPGFVQKKLDSKSEKEKVQEKPQRDTSTEQPKKKTNPLGDIQFSFDLVKQVVTAAKGIMARIFKAIKFRDLSLRCQSTEMMHLKHSRPTVLLQTVFTLCQCFCRNICKLPLKAQFLWQTLQTDTKTVFTFTVR